MNNLRKIDSLLRNQDFTSEQSIENIVYCYAEGIAEIERSVVVVSDLKNGSSRIFCGEFAKILGISGYSAENSIWEKEILRLLDESQLEAKYLSEIRFFNFIRKIARNKRSRYSLFTPLRFRTQNGGYMDVAHRMYYRYDQNGTVRYGICVYSPITHNMESHCRIIDSLTGESIELDSASDKAILSQRELQVLRLIERGLTSDDIAGELYISRYTVSRHRQEIISRLQVRNSAEACRVARQLGIL